MLTPLHNYLRLPIVSAVTNKPPMAASIATLASPVVEAILDEVAPTVQANPDAITPSVPNQPSMVPAATLANAAYSNVDLETINSVAQEAQFLFPVGQQFPQELRELLRKFGHKKGFEITSIGTKFTCTRCDEPNFRKNERNKRASVPVHIQRKRTATRVGCLFQITYSFVDWKNQVSNKSIKITDSSIYSHTNGCLPSRSQLGMEKRKSGTFTSAINETQIKAILAVMESNSRIPTNMLRELMRPLYPVGTSLDAKLIFNFRLKLEVFVILAVNLFDDIPKVKIRGNNAEIAVWDDCCE